MGLRIEPVLEGAEGQLSLPDVSFGCIIQLWPKQFGEATEILQLDRTMSHHLEWKASHRAFSRKGSLQSFMFSPMDSTEGCEKLHEEYPELFPKIPDLAQQ